MTRNSTGDWTEQSPFVPRRIGGYYLGDSQFEPTLSKGILSLFFGKENGDFTNSGYYQSIFDLSSTPIFTLISGSSSTSSSYGFDVNARNISGSFQHIAPYSFENSQKLESRVKFGTSDFLLSSINREADPAVEVFTGGAAAALTGVNSVLALSSTTRTKRDPENSIGLESATSKLIASVIKNNQKSDFVVREDNGSDFVYGYSPVIAGCTSGNGILAYVKNDGKIVSIDYTNDSSTNQTATPIVPTPTAPTPGSSGSDACPEDISKTSAGICGCGLPELDSNSDTLIDCGAPRAFVKNIIPRIVSATPNGKGKLTVQVEGLSGTKLKYSLNAKGKKYSKDFNASKLKVNLSKLPSGTITLKLKVTQKVGKKTVKSKASAAYKVTVE